VTTQNAFAEPPAATAACRAAEDARLVRRARLGDAAAFEGLYRAHVGRVHALCLRLAGTRNAAEDLTQEVFVRAWRKLSTFRGEAAFGTWLYRLALNVVVSELRSGRLDGDVPADEDPGFAGRQAPGRTPELGLDLERAIAALPDGARKVFVLHDISGLRHDEIARVMGIAVGTARVHLHNARSRLREVLR
jgi:RNA polymerase sigma-70 factor (ECF subfamily)